MSKMRITDTEVWGFRKALEGMRNPMNSWNLQDSNFYGLEEDTKTDTYYESSDIGKKDMELAKRLIKGGSEHCKFLRQIQVWCNIDMPRYWWSEMDTYKFNTKNSCSTMHKLLDKKNVISLDMFVYCEEDKCVVENIVNKLNEIRQIWLDAKTNKDGETQNRCLIRAKRILPEGFLQMRTVNTTYAELRNMYHQRKNHRLKESWNEVFCKWVEGLPYANEFIIGKDD